MASLPQRDDDRSKKPAQPDHASGAPRTPTPAAKPPATPRQPIPNMSLDEPDDELLEVEKVLEAEPVPMVEAVPDSAIAIGAPGDQVPEGVEEIAEPIAEAIPDSDVFLADDVVEEAAEGIAAPKPPLAQPVSDLIPAHEAVLADEALPDAEVSSALQLRQPITGMARPSEVLKEITRESASSVAAREAVAASAVPIAAPVEEPVAQAAPVSDVNLAEIFAETSEPVSAAPVEEAVAEEEVAEAIPSSDILADEAAAVEEAEDVAEAVEELAEAAPASAVAEAEAIEEVSEAAPASAVAEAEPIEEVAEAAPASAVWPVDEVDEVADVLPSSDVVSAEPVEEVAEAVPASDIAAAEEVEEIAEVMSASAVIAEEVVDEVAEALPTSDVLSAEDAEEVVEAASEVSSATRQAESVISEDEDNLVVAEAEAEEEEAAEVADVAEELTSTEFMDDALPPRSGTVHVAEEAVLEAEPKQLGSSSVLFDEIGEETGAAKPVSPSPKAANLEMTMAYEPGSSGKLASGEPRKGPPSSLVTEEELAGAPEASAVDLGEMPSRKGSSATGIDKVAEALESGVEDNDQLAETAAPEPSVMFDDLVDDEVAEAEDAEPPSSKKKKKKKAKAKAEDESTEMDVEAAEAAEEAEEVEAPKPGKKGVAKKGKKGSKVAVETAEEEPDLDALFDESDAEVAEGAEAVDEDAAAAALGAGDADETEAAEAFDEEVEAADAEDADEKSTKKTGLAKKTARHEEAEEAEAEAAEEEVPEAAEDEDEDLAAKKKKGKKEQATVAPAYQGPGFVMRWAGRFFLMFFGMALLGGAGVGAYFLADEDMKKQVAEQISEPPPPKPRPAEDVVREQFVRGNYDAAQKAGDPNVRGQAKWLAYYKKQLDSKQPLNPDAAEVKDAIKDLTSADNKLALAQIQSTFGERDLDAKLTEQKGLLTIKEKDIADIVQKKDKAEKLVDDLGDVLAKGKLIEDKTKLDLAMLPKLIKSLNDDRATLDGVNKILKDSDIKTAGEEGLKEVFKLKKASDDAYAEVNKVLDGENIKDRGAKGVAKIIDDRNATTKDLGDLMDTVKIAFKELVDGKIVNDPKADPRKDIVKGVQAARQKAESPLSIPLAQLGLSLGNIGMGSSKAVEDTFELSKTLVKLGWFQTREPFIQTPQQKMDTHITLLQDRKQNNKVALDKILLEAKWVLDKESESSLEAQGKAQYVQGLVQRNQEQFDDARKSFDEALKMSKTVANVGAWKQLAQQSLKELVDPGAYYVPRMERFQVEGNLKAALLEADLALKAMPTEAKLFAQRGLIRYEAVRGQGPKVDAGAQKAIRDDAETAGKDDKMMPESSYIVGLLEEELGNMNEAEKLYRQAIKTHEDRKLAADDAGKYRIALARLLLRDRTEAAPPEEKKAEEKKEDEKPRGEVLRTPGISPGFGVPQPRDSDEERVIIVHPWSVLVVANLVAQAQPDEVEDEETRKRLQETLKLAQELIDSKNDKIRGQGLMLRGSALSKLGRRTEGLRDYSKGLQLLFPGIATAEMTKLIDDHPAFQQPDATGMPNPVMAERHFGEGMHFYWSKQYVEAETQFAQAVKYYDKDARYLYYRGLAQYAQGTKRKRAFADYSFEVGARLEASTVAINPLAVRDINASLERIQGDLRQYLNAYRYRTYPDTPPRSPDEPEVPAKAP